uniref:Endonuclease IV n=1 Tax=Virus NIOZ-UU159 TaxID=2763270 RepID=A0A7S9SU68_9VIRU|nr:MAG: endonuclease IV [Virus NIOZ-UU159]|tara:strand:+ start:552 stop:1403 length:852 start_codon:yes stop_codon:yes gene_type:complete
MQYVGAHINRDKTIVKTMENIKSAGGNALQIFISSPRSTALTDIAKYDSVSREIKEYLTQNNFKLVIHSPYVINVASEFKNGKRTLTIDECYWIKTIINQLEISDLIGSIGVVLHVGKHVKLSYKDGLENMRTFIKYVLNDISNKKLNTKLIIETPAGQGTELLTDLKDFVEFYNSFTKDEQKYLGICLDTAHTWALGYDLNEAYNILFSKSNAKNITLIHLNNSLVEKGARKDRHATILDGMIPNDNMNDFIKNIKKNKTVIILETPSKDYDKEIAHIYNIK